MTANEIIQEIEALPPQEQAEIIRFACRLDAARQLTGPESASLAEHMAGRLTRLKPCCSVRPSRADSTAGQPAQVALTAVMRKLLLQMNRVLKVLAAQKKRPHNPRNQCSNQGPRFPAVRSVDQRLSAVSCFGIRD